MYCLSPLGHGDTDFGHCSEFRAGLLSEVNSMGIIISWGRVI